MVDSGATHNFILSSMLEIVKAAAPNCVQWQHASKPLRVSLADDTVVLSTKLVTISLQLAEDFNQTVEFRFVPWLNHPIILGMSWLCLTNPSIDWRTLEILWEGRTVPATAKQSVAGSRATLCNAQQFCDILKAPSARRKAFAVRIDVACTSEAGHLFACASVA